MAERTSSEGTDMRLITLFLATLFFCLPATADTVKLGNRQYEIVLPSNPIGAPLILALHGGGGNPDQFALATGFGRAAVAKGYAVAFPAGSGRRGDKLLTWNGGYCCGYAAKARVKDEAFLSSVIKDAEDRFGVNGDRVYITGMSNGSIMSETFAARNPDLVRAVAGVAGTMDTSNITVQGKVPTLIIHGTADTMVPYEGGPGDTSLTRTDFASVASVVAAFLEPWGGNAEVGSREINRKEDGTSVIVTDHRIGGKIVLRLMTIENGAHHWPGGRKARLKAGKTQEIDANAEILRFFAENS
jgi:polyhydroxybutyrate depolymerase